MATAETEMQFRLRTDEKKRIRQSAALIGVSASQFVLRAALTEADHIEADRRKFVVHGDKFDAFMDALNQPPTRNTALNKLLHTNAPWD